MENVEGGGKQAGEEEKKKSTEVRAQIYQASTHNMMIRRRWTGKTEFKNEFACACNDKTANKKKKKKETVYWKTHECLKVNRKCSN